MTSTWTNTSNTIWTNPVYLYQPRQYNKSAFRDYVNEQMKQAEAAINEDCNRTIWGEAPVRNEELRRCIADAYDKHTTTSTEEGSAMDAAISKVMDERKEERARKVLDYLDANWGEPEFGETHVWSATFDATPDKEYHYAAIFAGDHRWYVTKDTTPYTTEALKAHIADICLRAEVYFNGELVA